MRSVFSDAKKLSATALSWQFPRRLMLASRLLSLKNFRQSEQVYWTPWSECTKTRNFGLRRQTAINNASITKSALGLLFMLQPITFLENKSITTVRYSQPSYVLMYVKSVTQHSSGLATLNWRASVLGATCDSDPDEKPLWVSPTNCVNFHV